MAYQPAGMTTGSPQIAHLASVYYNKTGLDRLQKKFLFRGVCDKDMPLAQNSGKTVQFFRYQNPGAVTTPSPEGTVGTSGTISSRILTATVSQYTSFITLSDFLVDTAIDPIITNASVLLGYQAGLTVDTITRSVIDAESASTNMTLLSPSNYLRLADLRDARHSLQGVDVQPFDNGYFEAIVHPYVTFDLVNDPATNGLADVFKHTAPDKASLQSYEDRGTITHAGGCRVVESTNVFEQTTPNRYRGYVFGRHGVACVDLAGRGPSDVKDPKKQRFAIKSRTINEISVADPANVIRGICSYNFVFTTVILEGPAGIGGEYRYKTFDAESSIA